MAGGISPGTGISAVAVNLASPGAIGGTTPATITGTVVTATTRFVAPASGNPTYVSSGDTSTGLGWSVAGEVAYWSQGNIRAYFGRDSDAFFQLGSAFSLSWSSTTAGNGTTDLVLSRDAANTLAQKNGNNAQTHNTYAGNGGCHGLVSFNESLTIAAAATTDSATTIPAGAQIVAVSVRVTTVIPTAATFTVTAASGGTTFNTAAVTVAAGSTDPGTAAGGATYTAGGTKIRITPSLTPGAATGVVRICGYYRLITPPTS